MSVTHKRKHEKRALSTVCRTAVSYPQMTSCPQDTGPCAVFPPSLCCSCLTSRILCFPDTSHPDTFLSLHLQGSRPCLLTTLHKYTIHCIFSLPSSSSVKAKPTHPADGRVDGTRDIYSSFFSYRNISGSVFALLAFLYLIVIGFSKRAFCISSRLGLSQLCSFSHGIRSTLKT